MSDHTAWKYGRTVDDSVQADVGRTHESVTDGAAVATDTQWWPMVVSNGRNTGRGPPDTLEDLVAPATNLV